MPTLRILEARARYVLISALAEGQRILDVDCAEGLGIATLLQAGAHSITAGCDDREAMQAALPEIDTAHVHLHAPLTLPLPFEDHVFDLLICHDLSERIAQDPRWLTEVRRVLTKSGYLMTAIVNPQGANLEGPPEARCMAKMSYEELFEHLAPLFDAATVFGQSPVVANLIFDFESAEEDPDLTLDRSLLQTEEEEPGWYVLLFGPQTLHRDDLTLVQHDFAHYHQAQSHLPLNSHPPEPFVDHLLVPPKQDALSIREHELALRQARDGEQEKELALQALRQKFRVVETALQQSRSETEDLRQAVSEARNQTQLVSARHRQLEELVRTLQSEIHRRRHSLTVAEKRCLELKAALQSSQERFETYQRDVKSRIQELEQQRDDGLHRAVENESLAASQISKLRRQLADAQDEAAQWTVLLNEAESRLLEAQNAAQALSSASEEKFESLRHDLDERLSQVREEERQAALERLEVVRTESIEAQALAKSEAAELVRSAELKAAERIREAQDITDERLRQSQHQADQRIAHIQERADKDIAQLRAEIERLRQNHQTEIEQAQSAAQGQVEQDRRRTEEHLRNLEDAMEIRLAEARASAERLVEESQRQAQIMLDKIRADADDTLQGAQARIHELEQLAQEAQGKQEQLTQALLATEDRLSEAHDALQQVQSQRDELISLRQLKKSLEAHVDDTERQLNQERSTGNQWRAAHDSVAEELRTTHKEADGLRAQITRITEDLVSERRRADLLHEETTALRTALQAAQEAIQTRAAVPAPVDGAHTSVVAPTPPPPDSNQSAPLPTTMATEDTSTSPKTTMAGPVSDSMGRSLDLQLDDLEDLLSHAIPTPSSGSGTSD
ncbi:MAG: methyltransferase domain-containing protein [Myxococcota bacterium]